MSTKRPALLLFDLGGVLIESSVFEHLRRLLPEPVAPTELKERWLYSLAVRRFERGESSPTEFAENFVAEWRLEHAPEVFLAEFSSWPRGFFPGVRQAILDWRKAYKVGCLSNSNLLHCAQLGELEEIFDIALFSHRLGAIKPDGEIFMLALRLCELEASEIVFFDDSPANVRTAQSLGMTAFCVEGFDAVRAVLYRQGLV